MRITTDIGGQHHEVIPNHDPIKLGILHGIPGSIAAHHQMSRDELLSKPKL